MPNACKLDVVSLERDKFGDLACTALPKSRQRAASSFTLVDVEAEMNVDRASSDAVRKKLVATAVSHNQQYSRLNYVINTRCSHRSLGSSSFRNTALSNTGLQGGQRREPVQIAWGPYATDPGT
ncbi:hypothetical protein H072_5990 [Dactylellina haptotyla CBS 200.50]|uniref:Uncharacterized protein n=1 Tax=Dactylellina haptotyla (strain CBS 200.50) TaxID=1284197 RepID=S8AB74_DACHA|nr:hypothetical protein H072_5990 [Dactylellina haptotyla CBS 200.50]